MLCLAEGEMARTACVLGGRDSVFRRTQSLGVAPWVGVLPVEASRSAGCSLGPDAS